MVEKSEFHGDVGQAVVGNVNEAQRNSNVVNLTIGAQSAFKPLTKMQRQDITDTVKALVAAGDSSALAIYRVLLNAFGAANMDMFPGDKFREAMALLNARMPVLPKPLAAATIASPPSSGPVTVPCDSCVQHALKIKRLRLTLIVQWALLFIAAVLCGWLLWPSTVQATPESVVETRCFVDGREYSIGSFSKMPNGPVRECIQDKSGESPRWSSGARK